MISPFKFLDSYTRKDREIFFGRDREIEELYQKVFESKILLVYGISGTGKTSLINCGLANKFEESDWLPINIRRGKDINESMESELRRVALTPLKESISVLKAVQSVYLDHFKPVYLIFDQFEELFIFGDRQERDDFIGVITELIQSDIQCKCLFSVREEYLANMTEFEQMIDDILDNRIRVEKMTRVHAVDVIEGPCRVHQIELEEGFAQQLLDKLSPDSNEIELTFLQVFLDRVFKMADLEGERLKFTTKMIGEIGDVSNLLGHFLEEQIRELEDPDAGMTILKAFVSVKGTKRQVEDSEILDSVRALGKDISPEDITVLVQKFIKLRILRDKDENGRYELRHDSLAAKIYENITLVEKELLEIRQFIENAFEVWQKRGILLDKEDLEYIAPYEKKLFLEGRLKDFIEKCRRILEVKKRSFRRIMVISAAGFLLILSAIAIYSFRQSFSLRAERLALRSSLQRNFSLPMSYNSAKAANEKDPESSMAAKALLDVFYELLHGGPYVDSAGHVLDPQKAIFDFSPVGSDIENAKFSEDGSLIYGYLKNGAIKVWDRQGHELFSKTDSSGQVIDMIISPDNRTIAVVFRDSTANFWNMSGMFITSINLDYEPLSPRNAVAFSRDSRTFAVSGRDNQLEFYDSGGNFLYELSGHSAPVTGISFSPDSQYLASSSKDSSIIIWEADGVSGRFEKFRQIRKHIDAEVWAVDFALNSRWILCTANRLNNTYEKDSIWEKFYTPVRVINFNGDSRTIIFYNVNNVDTIPWRLSDPVYDARFTGNNTAIVYNTIDYDSTFGKDSLALPGVQYRLTFSKNSLWWTTNVNRIIKKDKPRESNEPYTLQGADVSIHGYVASCITDTETTNLIHFDGIPLKKFQGIRPVFSPDGNYLLCTRGNELSLYPASVSIIVNLVDDRNIFGEMEVNMSDWRHYVF